MAEAPLLYAFMRCLGVLQYFCLDSSIQGNMRHALLYKCIGIFLRWRYIICMVVLVMHWCFLALIYFIVYSCNCWRCLNTPINVEILPFQKIFILDYPLLQLYFPPMIVHCLYISILLCLYSLLFISMKNENLQCVWNW